MSELRSILDWLPMGVWIARAPDGQVEYANPAFAEIMGTGPIPESRIGDAPRSYGIHDREGHPYAVEKLPFSLALMSRKAVMVDDIVIHRGDGGRVNIRAFATPKMDARSEVEQVIVVFQDITREVEAGRARDTMGAHLALVVNHAPIAVWTADKDGVVTMSEGAGLASMGVKPGQLVGQSLFDLYREHPTIPGYLRRGLAGEAFWYTVEVPGAIYDTYVTPLRGAGAEIVGVAGLSNDVTEVRKLEANAIQNDRIIALGTLAASVAHEINNPLTYLITHFEMGDRDLGSLERILQSNGDPAADALALVKRVRAHLEPIRSAAERMARITAQLKTFSRSYNERLAPVDVRSVVGAVVDLVGKDVEARARLHLDLAETAHVVADEARLVQVVLNLVVNAMHAVKSRGRETGEIVVRTRNLEDRVAIEVADNGPGVPVGDRERIFQPFFSTKGIGEGSGLGLFVCRNIVRTLGGDIAVEDRPGGGVLFRVALPRSREDSAAPATRVQAQVEPPPEPRARILLIDDDTRVEWALSEALRSVGHEVTSANDGARGLDLLLSSAPFDLIFCDLMMRGMTGMELAAALRQRAPHRLDQVVFMSGGAFTSEAQAFLDAHPGRSVDKPFDIVRETQARLRAGRAPAR